jgi:sarcosine oxidase subunit gamma
VPELTRLSALAGHLPSAVSDDDPAVLSLHELRPAGIAQLLGAAEPARLLAALGELGLDEAPASGRAAGGEALSLLWNGPQQYLAVSMSLAGPVLQAGLQGALGGDIAAVVDLSHARTVLALQGPACVDLLAKGCPLDLDNLDDGAVAATVLGHYNVLLHRVDPRRFRIYVFRSFALACFEWMMLAGREYGLRAGG